MENNEKLKQDVHDCLKMLAKANRWLILIQNLLDRAKQWFRDIDIRVREIAKDIE